LSAKSLVDFYNSRAPHEYKISNTGSRRMLVSAFGERPTGKDMAAVLEHFSRAVASIGREIQDPGSEHPLGPADYRRAPIYPTTLPNGPLVLVSDRGDLAFESLPSGPTTAEMALERLASLLPEDSNDPAFAGRLLAARTPTARAIHEVALAAKRTHGLRVTLEGLDEPIASAVDVEQAELITDLLRDTREDVKRMELHGRLDGVRFRRREFYLDVQGSDIHGLVDEHLVPAVRHLLDHNVIATVERIVRITAAGTRQQPQYRLVNLAESPTLFGK
jgi:hypothetical protein